MTAEEIIASHLRRVAATDSAVAVGELAEGEALAWPGVVGRANVRQADPELLLATWGTLVHHMLALRWDGTPGALAAAINSYLDEHGQALAEPDVSVSVSWPARDVAATVEFLQTPLRPLSTVALRRARPQQIAAPAGIVLRRAVPEDVEGIVALQLAEVRYDEQVSDVTLRPSTEPAARARFAESLGAPDPWIWVAASGDDLVGVTSIERPEAALWITASTSVTPTAYLGLGSVAPQRRGGGVGTALAAHALTHIEETGMVACLLHFSTLNPLSSPFWSRLGFRPLTQTWSTFPQV